MTTRWWLWLLASGPLAGASVTSLEGTRRDLDPVTWTANDVAGRPLADLDRIVLGAATPVAKAGFGVWLADGSWLPAERLDAAGADRLAIISPLGTLTVPLAAVRGWGVSDPAVVASGDDRLLLAGGSVDGRISGLSPQGVLALRTALDPEPITVALAEVPAASIAVSAQTTPGTTLLLILAEDRPAVRLRPVAGGLVLAVGGSPVTPPAGTLVVDGPRRVWLSRLEPAQVEDRGAFGVVWPWRRDTDLDGGPLRLDGRRYATGLTAHSAATLRWTLGGAYTRLRGRIGISDLVAPEGDADVRFLADERELWRERRLRGGEPAKDLDLDLAGVTTLTWDIGLGERYDIGDHVTLADAYLVRR